MRPTTKRLVSVSALFLVAASIGAAVAISDGAEATGRGDANDVAKAFIGGRGTPLSPPLTLMLSQAIFTVHILIRGRWGTLGVIGLAFLGEMAIFVIIDNSLHMESPPPEFWFNMEEHILRLAIGLLAGLTLIFGVLELSDRIRACRGTARVATRAFVLVLSSILARCGRGRWYYHLKSLGS